MLRVSEKHPEIEWERQSESEINTDGERLRKSQIDQLNLMRSEFNLKWNETVDSIF